MLVNDCRSAVESVGLDPQYGYLHTMRSGRPALALDLMEEFRSILGDRIALTLINRGQLQAKHFEWRVGGSVYLNDQGIKVVLTAYEKRKRDQLQHPLLETKVSLGLMPMIQAQMLARVIRGDMENYIPFWLK